MKWLRRLAVAVPAVTAAWVLMMAGAGCGTSGNDVIDAGAGGVGGAGSSEAGESAPPPIDRLLTGDRIRITFYGPPSPPQPHVETIRRDGFITPPLLGRQVAAAGKSIEQLQDELHGLYVPAFYKTLTITITAEERYFFVGGYVATPGMIPYRADMTLLKALQAAGDVTIWAWRSHVSINRNNGRTEVYDIDEILKNPSLDPPVYPGDSVHVPRRII